MSVNLVVTFYLDCKNSQLEFFFNNLVQLLVASSFFFSFLELCRLLAGLIRAVTGHLVVRSTVSAGKMQDNSLQRVNMLRLSFGLCRVHLEYTSLHRFHF